MALFRRRTPAAPDALPAEPVQQAVLGHYAVGARKSDVDRFFEVQEVLDQRLGPLGVGFCDGNDIGGGEGTVFLLGSDCRQLWAAAERAVAMCPLAAREVELRPGDVETPRVVVPLPERQDARLRPGLELTTAAGDRVRRRLTAFDLLRRLEGASDEDWISVAEDRSDAVYVQCQRQGDRWVVERRAGGPQTHQHTWTPDLDEVLTRLLDWAGPPPAADDAEWIDGVRED